jgi:hypothetical protein
MSIENIKIVIQPYKVPRIIFIIPYRDREQQRCFFSRQMKYILEDMNRHDYEIYFAHQIDTRDFNRGAMKNIGFIAMKQKYPDDYKDITFVFNDIDTMPYTKDFLKYETTVGNVKHFYGYNFTLGGIVSIKGIDFEKTNGYPNFWAWGYEDNMFYDRVLACGLNVDRSQFYPVMDKNILQLNDGLSRIVNKNEYNRYVTKTTDGIIEINNLEYTIKYMTMDINITNFKLEIENNKQFNSVHDIRKGHVGFGRRMGGMKMSLGL